VDNWLVDDEDFRARLVPGADLRGLVFPAGHGLSGVDLQGADLRGADLSCASWWQDGADFGNANLSGADLRLTKLGVATFNHANLSGANLARIWLGGAPEVGWPDFIAANLTGANLSDTNLPARFTDAILDGADLTGAQLSHVDLTNASLVGADLTRADLSYATLTNADLCDASLIDARIPSRIMTRVDYNRLGVPDPGNRPRRWIWPNSPVPASTRAPNGRNTYSARLRRTPSPIPTAPTSSGPAIEAIRNGLVRCGSPDGICTRATALRAVQGDVALPVSSTWCGLSLAFVRKRSSLAC
jgi:uncharacterized protein YjbI with pentapeptide repeats